MDHREYLRKIGRAGGLKRRSMPEEKRKAIARLGGLAAKSNKDAKAVVEAKKEIVA
jgi:hypothetical protein